jgi:hypothetical protein
VFKKKKNKNTTLQQDAGNYQVKKGDEPKCHG